MIYVDPKTLSGKIPEWLKHGKKVALSQQPVLFTCSTCGRAYTQEIWAKHFTKCV